jgi:hypothetical protein
LLPVYDFTGEFVLFFNFDIIKIWRLEYSDGIIFCISMSIDWADYKESM